jgi:hypothetical protein
VQPRIAKKSLRFGQGLGCQIQHMVRSGEDQKSAGKIKKHSIYLSAIRFGYGQIRHVVSDGVTRIHRHTSHRGTQFMMSACGTVRLQTLFGFGCGKVHHVVSYDSIPTSSSHAARTLSLCAPHHPLVTSAVPRPVTHSPRLSARPAAQVPTLPRRRRGCHAGA